MQLPHGYQNKKEILAKKKKNTTHFLKTLKVLFYGIISPFLCKDNNEFTKAGDL